MALDWGEFFTGAAQDWISRELGVGRDFLGGDGGDFEVVPPVNGGKFEVDTRTGKVTKCKRRRRRRLLTPTDLSDLAALQALVGKGSTALNMAVAKAVRR